MWYALVLIEEGPVFCSEVKPRILYPVCPAYSQRHGPQRGRATQALAGVS